MTAPEARAVSLAVPIGAGVVTALVGFTSSFAVVLTGLRAAGATEAQAASGLFALSLIMGFGIVGLALRYRIPLTLAWSTPGAALLAGTGAVVGSASTAATIASTPVSKSDFRAVLTSRLSSVSM